MKSTPNPDQSSVVLLTNFLPPYRLPVLRELADRLGKFEIFLSTKMEADRLWKAEWKGLRVSIQRGFTLKRKWRHPHGFVDDNYVHVPYDTYATLKSLRPDVVISAELGLRTLQAAMYRKMHSGSRLIIWATLSEETEQGRGLLRNLIRKWIVPAADAVLVNGESGARYIQRFGFSDAKIFRTPQATEIAPYLALPLRPVDSTLRLLYVGRLIELKGLVPFLEVLVRYARANPERKFEFDLVGDGPLREALEAIVRPANLNVRLFGNVAYEDLPAHYGKGGVLVLPTLSDEWGLVVVEAMASGLPVLGSVYSQAVTELVDEGKTGWRFAPGKADETFAALDRAAKLDAGAFQEMRARARERVKDFSPAFMAERISVAIRSVLNG